MVLPTADDNGAAITTTMMGRRNHALNKYTHLGWHDAHLLGECQGQPSSRVQREITGYIGTKTQCHIFLCMYVHATDTICNSLRRYAHTCAPCSVQTLPYTA